MDFAQTRDGAAREIALAFGVPPMLLGLPGDNTYSNFQEANRAFWRQSVIPLVGRLHKSFAAWLTPAYGALRFEANLDRIDALAEERALEWRRIGAADFLTLDERREAAGYGPAPEGFVAQGIAAKEFGGRDSAALELRYSPDQPRAPAGSSDGGRWVPAGGGGFGGGGWNTSVADNAAQNTLIAANDEPKVANDAGGLLKPRISGSLDKIDLTSEEGGEHKGHGIREHVGKDDQYLLRRVRESRKVVGPFTAIQRASAFSSLESANKLVVSTIRANYAFVEKLAKGELDRDRNYRINSIFGSITGKEAYARSPRSQPEIRAVRGVAVVLKYTGRPPHGFKEPLI